MSPRFPPWSLVEGPGPLIATALHSGHEVRDEIRDRLALSAEERLREEDPYSDQWAELSPTRVVAYRSRFEVDLNRPRELAVYGGPEEAWGLDVWKRPLPEAVRERSLAIYDDFYATMHRVISERIDRMGRFLVFDLHSYNHQRKGPCGPGEDPRLNPDVNLGTGKMDRQRWAPLLDRFVDLLSSLDVLGRRLDVRENVRFHGGHFAQWVHATFPDAGCVLAIEVKKFFMDEWSGRADPRVVTGVRSALAATVAPVLEELERLAPAYR